MNKDTFKGNWKEIKGKVKQQWGKLTDDDVTTIEGSWDELEGKLQSRYGWQKEQANKEMENWLNKGTWSWNKHTETTR